MAARDIAQSCGKAGLATGWPLLGALLVPEAACAYARLSAYPQSHTCATNTPEPTRAAQVSRKNGAR